MPCFSYNSRTFSPALLFLLIGGIASCSSDSGLRNKGDAYLRTSDVQVIVVPEGLDNSRIGEIYPIPQGGEVASYELENEFEVPKPNSITANVAANDVRIQNLGEEFWILVSLTPSEAWPRVRNELTALGIPAFRTDATSGVIETSLISFKDDEFNSHQFRLQLSQGVQTGTTEIAIKHRDFPKNNVPNPLPEWSIVSESVDRESWLRTSLANSLANNLETGTASLLGQEIGAAQKVAMVTPEAADPYIQLFLSFERAWGSVGYSLSREGFRVDDQDRTAGIYYTSYAPPILEEDKPGFLARMIGVDEKERERTKYQVQLRPGSEAIEVRIFRTDGSSLTKREAFNLLTIIRNNLT